MNNYFLNLYQVLKCIKLASSNNIDVYSLIDLEKMKINKYEFEIILENIINEGLIINNSPSNFYKKGTINLNKPHLTTKGYEFLNENSLMKKIYKVLKETKEWIPSL